MFKLLSNLELANRQDVTMQTGDVSVSGYEGSWVTLNAQEKAILTTGANVLTWPVWSEAGDRTGSDAGYTPDVSETGKVTILKGYFKALTDKYNTGASITLGTSLVTGDDGLLTAASGSETPGQVKAVCYKSPHSITYLGTTFTVIGIEKV